VPALKKWSDGVMKCRVWGWRADFSLQQWLQTRGLDILDTAGQRVLLRTEVRAPSSVSRMLVEL
jgi:hypothetical protein